MSQKFKSELELQALNNATTDTDKFLVSDGGIVKYRTGAEMLSDLGVAPGVASNIQHQVKAGVAINKGQAVYVTSADGTNMIVGLASNASEATSSKTMGLLDATVAINGFANVVAEGLLSGLNTSTANAGDPVWLGTGGNLIYGLANKPYAPAHLVFIGIVTRVNTNNGEIFVKVQNGFELNEIHDIDLKTTTPINGHILGFDGTLWVNKTIAGWLGYTPANASGTTNYLSKFTGSTTLGNSLLFDDGTYVGIGTTSPLNSLQVSRDQTSDTAIIVSNAGTAGATTTMSFILQEAGTPLGWFRRYRDGSGLNEIGFNTDLAFSGNIASTKSERMRITSAGNVGIGTTNPTVKLHIVGDVYTSTGYVAAGNSYMNSIGNTSTNNNANLSLTTSGVRASRNVADSNTVFAITNLNASSTGAIQTWNNSGGELMRVTQNGNVGIGTSSPSYKLDVNGSINVSSGSTIRWGSGDADIYNSGYDLVFRTWTGSALTEKLRITSAGNVGIGTTTPQVDLEVASKDATSTVARIRLTNKDISVIDEQDLSEIQFYNSDADGAHVSAYIKNIAAELYGRKGQLAFGVSTTNSTNAVEAFRIDENANIGIGTTSPTDKLTVNGTFRSTALWTTSGGITQWGNGTTSYGTLTWDAGYARIHAASGNRLDLGASAGLHMSIATSGNVGIGTTSPTQKLDINGGNVLITSAAPYISLKTTQTGTPDWKLYNSYNVVGDFAIVGGTSVGNKFNIQPDGNVGIGTTSPSQKLDVVGAGKFSSSVQVGDDSTVASATNVGATRYRSDANNSYMDMVMQTGASTYAWVNVVQNTW